MKNNKNYNLQKSNEKCIYNQRVHYKRKLSLRIFINTSPSAVSDPKILKLISNEHLVQIQHWMSQSNPDRILFFKL